MVARQIVFYGITALRITAFVYLKMGLGNFSFGKFYTNDMVCTEHQDKQTE
jgi:hypothetical protein